MLSINVTNRMRLTETFSFFQQPAVFSGGDRVYSNVLYSQILGSYDATGATLTFQADQQAYASIQQAHQPPQTGLQSGFSSAVRAIDLTRPGSSSANATTASITPLGLSRPVNQGGVQPGAFRIITPAFAPTETYNIGSAVDMNGTSVLSSFVVALPNYAIDCHPILKFYVRTGGFTPATVIDFDQAGAQAAVCDFTTGYSVINVTLEADGAWTVRGVQ